MVTVQVKTKQVTTAGDTYTTVNMSTEKSGGFDEITLHTDVSLVSG